MRPARSHIVRPAVPQHPQASNVLVGGGSGGISDRPGEPAPVRSRLRTRARGPASSMSPVVLLCLPNFTARRIASVAAAVHLLVRLSFPPALPARFDACRGERCPLPRVGGDPRRCPRTSRPCRFLCSLELALPAKRTSDGGRLPGRGPREVKRRSTRGPEKVQKVQRRSRIGPKSARGRRQGRSVGPVRIGQVCSGLHAVWTKSGPKLPSDHCVLFFFWIASEHGCRAAVRHPSLTPDVRAGDLLHRHAWTGLLLRSGPIETHSGSEDLAQSETSRESLG